MIRAAIGTGWSIGHRQVLGELAIPEHKVGHYFNQRRCTRSMEHHYFPHFLFGMVMIIVDNITIFPYREESDCWSGL